LAIALAALRGPIGTLCAMHRREEKEGADFEAYRTVQAYFFGQ
jgi:hypothetical protein